MIRFILNNEHISTDKPEGMALLDYIRDEISLPGTKIGCREGDCGACTVLMGSLINRQVIYKSIVSCLTPLGNVHGKHIVTLEGLNMPHLTPVQQAMVNNAATQCGFCTPGFIMGFTGYALSHQKPEIPKAIASVSGNICRCTGYKSIERAAADITKALEHKNPDKPVAWLVEQQYLPEYFLTIPGRLAGIEANAQSFTPDKTIMGGGTDLLVQKHDEIAESQLNIFSHQKEFKQIQKDKSTITIGCACTATDIAHNEHIKNLFPDIESFFRLISSEPIRNTGTIAGNIMNASPIGDLSIFFLALDATLIIRKENATREIPLKDFFIDYRKTDIQHGEFIESVRFLIPEKGFHFNYEKISKRTHLDIASVTSAIKIDTDQHIIKQCSFSAGGVKAIPLFLENTSRFFINQQICTETLHEANKVLQDEISPISDVRGSSNYKRLLLKQLLFAHFLKLFPKQISAPELLREDEM